jgi:hypothetical protein
VFLHGQRASKKRPSMRLWGFPGFHTWERGTQQSGGILREQPGTQQSPSSALVRIQLTQQKSLCRTVSARSVQPRQMESIVVSGQAMSIQISSCFPMATKLHKGKISNGETEVVCWTSSITEALILEGVGKDQAVSPWLQPPLGEWGGGR